MFQVYMNLLQVFVADRKFSFERIIVLHQSACRLMANGDSMGQVFLSATHTNDTIFVPFTTPTPINTPQCISKKKSEACSLQLEV